MVAPLHIPAIEANNFYHVDIEAVINRREDRRVSHSQCGIDPVRHTSLNTCDNCGRGRMLTGRWRLQSRGWL